MLTNVRNMCQHMTTCDKLIIATCCDTCGLKTQMLTTCEGCFFHLSQYSWYQPKMDSRGRRT